ncbi:chaplin [Kitasatospora mediocidica]|uniref:chaplin n=1 Tax=Kitasatospora mediocidica TaxID=58352 RepID=UPI00068BB3DB|nr:chaplin [Kitasatospora mediocidica]
MATGSVLASTAGYAYASADAQGLAANSPGVGSGNTVQVPVDAPVNVCGNTVDVIGLLNPAFGNQCANASPAHSHVGGRTWGGAGGSGAPGATGWQGGSGSGMPGMSGMPTMPDMPGMPGMPGASGWQGGTGTNGSPQSPGGPAHWPGMPDVPGVPAAGTGAASGAASGAQAPGGDWSTVGSSASGVSQGSPGVAAGNNAQAPVDVPVNACGNTVDVVGLGNPAMGDDCANQAAPTPPPAPVHNPPPPTSVPVVTPPAPAAPVVEATHNPAPPAVVAPVVAAPQAVKAAPVVGQLAFTGVDGLDVIAPAGLALLIAGGVLYRRSRLAA